jgi:hypothetical protein
LPISFGFGKSQMKNDFSHEFKDNMSGPLGMPQNAKNIEEKAYVAL